MSRIDLDSEEVRAAILERLQQDHSIISAEDSLGHEEGSCWVNDGAEQTPIFKLIGDRAPNNDDIAEEQRDRIIPLNVSMVDGAIRTEGVNAIVFKARHLPSSLLIALKAMLPTYGEFLGLCLVFS